MQDTTDQERTTRLRLSYMAYADHASGQVGEPGLAYPVPLDDCVIAYFRRDQEAELLGFEITDFSETFRKRRAWLASRLGDEVVAHLSELYEQVPSDLPDLDEVPDEQLEDVLAMSVRHWEGEIPGSTDELRRTWLEAIDYWVGEPGVSTEYEEEPASSKPGQVSVTLHLARALVDRLTAAVGVALEEAIPAIADSMTKPAFEFARVPPGELRERYIWPALAGNPAELNIVRHGDLLIAESFIGDARGASIEIDCILKPGTARLLREPASRLLSRGKIDDEGFVSLRLGRLRRGARITGELFDAVDVRIG
jgi:hypothetical protein